MSRKSAPMLKCCSERGMQKSLFPSLEKNAVPVKRPRELSGHFVVKYGIFETEMRGGT